MSAALYPVLFKVLSAYGFIALGIGIKRFTQFTEKQFSALLFYLLVPMLVFRGTAVSPLGDFMELAALSFAVSVGITILAIPLRQRFPKVVQDGLLLCAFGYFNNGWLGIPLGYAFFGEEGLKVMTALHMGGVLYGNTVGYTLLAGTGTSVTRSLRMLLKLPSLHAFAIGVLVNLLDLGVNSFSSAGWRSVFDTTSAITAVIGMSLVGMGIARLQIKEISWAQTAAFLSSRFALAFVVTGGVCALFLWLGSLSLLQAKVFLLMAILPIASNTLVFANMAGQRNPMLGFVLFVSTLVSCLLLPPVAMLFGGIGSS